MKNRVVTEITAAKDAENGDLDINVHFGEDRSTGFRLQVGVDGNEIARRLRKAADFFESGATS